MSGYNGRRLPGVLNRYERRVAGTYGQEVFLRLQVPFPRWMVTRVSTRFTVVRRDQVSLHSSNRERGVVVYPSGSGSFPGGTREFSVSLRTHLSKSKKGNPRRKGDLSLRTD